MPSKGKLVNGKASQCVGYDCTGTVRNLTLECQTPCLWLAQQHYDYQGWTVQVVITVSLPVVLVAINMDDGLTFLIALMNH